MYISCAAFGSSRSAVTNAAFSPLNIGRIFAPKHAAPASTVTAERIRKPHGIFADIHTFPLCISRPLRAFLPLYDVGEFDRTKLSKIMSL